MSIAVSLRWFAFAVVVTNLAFAVCPGRRHQTSFAGYALSPDGKRVAALADDGSLLWWDVATSQRRELMGCVGSGALETAIIFSPDGRSVAVDSGGAVLVFDPDKAAVIARLTDLKLTELYALRFSGDGRRLAASFAEGAVVWDIKRQSEVGSIEAPPLRNALAFNHSGTVLAVGSGDGVRLWEPDRKNKVRRLFENVDAESVFFAHEDNWLVTLTATAMPSHPGDHFQKYSREISVWEIATGRKLKTLDANPPIDRPVSHLAIAGKDTVLAFDYSDHLRAWNIKSGQMKGTWETEVGQASADGKLILRPGDAPGELEVWELGTPDKDARTLRYRSPLCAASYVDANGKVEFDLLLMANGVSDEGEPLITFSENTFVAWDCTPFSVVHRYFKNEEQATTKLQSEITEALEVLDSDDYSLLSPGNRRTVLRVAGRGSSIGYVIVLQHGKSLTEIHSPSLDVARAMERR